MLEAYSQNVTVSANTPIPLNSVSIQKGCTAERTGSNTIQLNKCGVYMVEFDCVAVASGTATGNITVQLMKNGTLQPQALTSAASTSATDVESLSFNTLVQVQESNSDCCCSSPTVINLQNTGIAAVFSQVNVTVTKIC
jgi:hypothetical protein